VNKMDEEEKTYVGISSAGVEHVEVNLPEKESWNFFQQLVKERPELDRKLVYWHFFTNKEYRERGGRERTIRETVYDLIEYVLNDFVEITSCGEVISTKSLRTYSIKS